MLKRQLYIIYFLSLFLPICVIGSFLLYNNYSMLYEHHQDMLISDNLRIRSIVFEATTSLTNVCDTVAEDTDFHALLEHNYKTSSEAREALNDFTLLDDIYTRQTEISAMTLYTNNTTLQNYGHFEVITDENKEWFYDTLLEPGYHWSTLSGINKFGVSYQELQLISPIIIQNSRYDAVLVISISNNYLKNRIDNNDLTVDVTVNHDPIFFSTWGNADSVIDFMDYHYQDFFRYSGVETYMGTSSLLEVSTIQPIKSDDSIYIFSRDPLAVQKIRNLQYIAALIICLSIIVPGYNIIRYTKQLTNRVETLRTEMHRVTGGDYNIIENFKGNDELVDLFKDLQTMIHSIKERDKTIFDSKMNEQKLIHHQKEIELELLSSKINPHFLYNTLETIRMKAFSSDDLEVAQAVKLLGKYMRYSLESTGDVTTLESELEYIHTYMSIQSLRFSDRITFTMEVDESINQQKILILPLLIQPIVENALIHGHEQTTENGLILIRCKDNSDYIHIEVIDNGTGIDKKKLKKIKDHVLNGSKARKTSFGLYNIQQRLLLFYGEGSLLHIESAPGKGTKIGFDIPKRLRKEQ